MEKQTTVVHVSPTEDDPTFGFEMEMDELHKRVYISNALKKSTAPSINKSKNGFRNNLKGAFLTHVNAILVISKSNAVEQLKLLKDRGVKESSITFAPEHPITGKKIRHAIDNYHHFSPGTTKKIKSNYVEEPADDIADVDDDFIRFHIGTVAFKVLGKVEHRGKVTRYNPLTKLYQIVYDDDDTK